MKIVVTGLRGFPDVQGGVERHCEKLYTNLIRNGCEITVFTRRPYVNHEIQDYKGINLIPIECPKNKYLEAIVHTFRCVVKARRLNPDILHIHAIGPSLFTPLARLLGMRVVMTHHGPDYKREKWPLPAKIFLRFCEMVGVRFANKVIAIADNIAYELKDRYNVDAVVIPNGVDIPERVGTDDVLKRFGIERDRYILAVGRFVPEKGFDYLIEAFNRLQSASHMSHVKDWKLVIVGDADHEDRYSIKLKEKARMGKDVILTGFQTGRSLAELYSHARLFVLPSFYEGLPIALLEAMSYGLSCIASDIPANRCIELEDDRFFKAGDTEAILEKIKGFINRPWNNADKKRQIIRLSEKYNWERIAEKTIKIYSDILE
ncbi:MAG: glycosyltransferase family 4 protein [Thermodesulfovibrionia bacterium]